MNSFFFFFVFASFCTIFFSYFGIFEDCIFDFDLARKLNTIARVRLIVCNVLNICTPKD